MTIDDAAILNALRSPETMDRGFRMLLDQYGEKLYWHIRRIVIGHEDAEDAVQESVLLIYKNINRFEGEACQLMPWIYKIATNEALRLLRSHTRLFRSIDSLQSELTERLVTESDVDIDRAEFLLQAALLALPTQQRIVFNMRYYDGLSYEDIALVTGKRVGTLKVNYHYARNKIEEYLTKHTP